MSLVKRNYIDGETVITAENLNNIQDAVIDLEATQSVPTNVRTAIYTLLENAAYVTTGLEDEIAVVEAWAEEVTSLTLSVSTLSLSNDVPQVITATTVPNGATVTWSSSNNSVATVIDGIVTGVSNGSCVITAYAGDLVATCDVTVSGFAELVSISAVYTQSGTVYDTDSIDSLKADLVVTATYSDSSTETIPSTDYTLSGTLEVGTSTITVLYGGKTTTFTVVVSDQSFVEWDYTDGDNGTITLLTDGGSASIQNDGIHLSSGNSTAWKWAQAYINIPDGISFDDKKTTVEVQFDSLVSPATNSAVAFFTGSPTTTSRLYTQADRLKTIFAGGTGSTAQNTDISSTWGNFSQSGTIKVVYNPSNGLLEGYKDGVLTYSNTTTVYSYDHSYGAGLIVETQRGSNSGAASITIKHIKLSWEDV